MTTPPRPPVLTLFCWFMIITSMINVALMPSVFTNPISRQMMDQTSAPAWVAIACMLASVAFQGTSAIAMLRRRRWGRTLYLAGMPVLQLAGYWLYSFQNGVFVLYGAMFYTATAIILTRHSVSAFFSNEQLEPSSSPDGTLPPPESVNAGRRIASVVLLVPASIILSSTFMIFAAMWDLGFAVFIVAAVMMFIACCFIVPALYLWGWKRWAILLGTLHAVIGGQLLMMAGAFHQLSTTPQFHEQLAATDPIMMAKIMHGSLVAGTSSVIIGAGLIVLQKVLDMKRADMGG